MDLPGWSETEPTVIGDLTLLPRNGRFESPRVGNQRATILNVTNGGVRTGYVLHERETATVRGFSQYIFEFAADQVADYKAIDDYAHGDVVDFWFVPDSSNMTDKIHCRLVDKEFLPEVAKERTFNGSVQQWFRWTMRISAEVVDQPLLD